MKTISIIVPAFNEGKNIPLLYAELLKVFEVCKDYSFEILFVNDGSWDETRAEMEKISQKDQRVSYIDFSRNFGKEIATTAGINKCQGDACMMIDADLQHPISLIPEFIKKWEHGFEVVVGIRNENKSSSWLKKTGSAVFYKTINKIAEIEVVPNATDFRLIDRVVIDEFNRFTETKRMTRSLIDWLGFKRDYIHFDANERIHGQASYTFWKLFALALNSFISLSLLPLKLAGYLGLSITLFSGMAGLYILLGKYFFRWRFASTFSDAENLAILIVFLVGIILISIGLMALYIANIHGEVINRPMYVIRKKKL
ncbi:MAG: hypothetical protein ACD_56C00097G0010 [uncultured bacterium]|nr:MAG: hypothetical protein ACD_56C00097G0010 [uncultured bacterium]